MGNEASFPRIKDVIKYEECGERKLTFYMYLLSFNYRSNTVGFNQMRSSTEKSIADRTY